MDKKEFIEFFNVKPTSDVIVEEGHEGEGDVDGWFYFDFHSDEEDPTTEVFRFRWTILMASGMKRIKRTFNFRVLNKADLLENHALGRLFADLAWDSLCAVCESRREGARIPTTRDDIAKKIALSIPFRMN